MLEPHGPSSFSFVSLVVDELLLTGRKIYHGRCPVAINGLASITSTFNIGRTDKLFIEFRDQVNKWPGNNTVNK